jgi:hypothetical protein
MHQGRITAAQLEEATRYIRSGMRLGQILLELGYLKGGEIEPYVRTHMMNVACAMLASDPQRLVFSDQVEVQADTLSPLPVADVLMEAVRRLPNIDSYRGLLLREECRLRLAHDRGLRSQRITLTPEEAFVLSRIQDPTPARALVGAGPLEEGPLFRALVGFIHAGLVEIQLETEVVSPGAGRSAPPRDAEEEISRLFEAFQCQNHWQVLGVERGARPEAIAAAHEEKASRFRAEAFQNLTDGDFQERLSFVTARIEEAYRVLTSRADASRYGELAEKESEYEKEKAGSWESPKQKSPQASAPAKNPQEAKQLFLRAKKAYAASDYWNTIQFCRAAIDLGENDPEYFHLLGQALGQNPKWRRDAEQNLNIAIKLSPWEPKYHVALAELYHRGGLQQRARKVLEHVATIDPNYPLPRLDKDPASERPAKAGEKVGQLIRKLGKLA